jgi:hypothetical protein
VRALSQPFSLGAPRERSGSGVLSYKPYVSLRSRGACACAPEGPPRRLSRAGILSRASTCPRSQRSCRFARGVARAPEPSLHERGSCSLRALVPQDCKLYKFQGVTSVPSGTQLPRSPSTLRSPPRLCRWESCPGGTCASHNPVTLPFLRNARDRPGRGPSARSLGPSVLTFHVLTRVPLFKCCALPGPSKWRSGPGCALRT